jgi:hypothetical protein
MFEFFEHCAEKDLKLFPIQKNFTSPFLLQTFVVSQKPHNDAMQIYEKHFKTLAKQNK